jgi:DNA-binding response OmpR family regulator
MRTYPVDVAHVLVAENEIFIALMLEDELVSAGCRVTLASNGDDALALARRDPPDVAVLNWGMPGTSRADLVRQLRALVPALPVVIVSGYEVTAEEIGAANDTNPIPVFTKPVDLKELMRTVMALRR